MISSLRGKLIYSDDVSVIVECGGVGLKCTVSKNTLYNLPEKNSEIFLYTHMSVREDAMDLFGFLSLDELNAFKMIISVNGVGPKIGIALLSEFSALQLNKYIIGNDAKSLTAASGVGIKLAQRIVLELKDKVSIGSSADVLDIPTSSKKQETGFANEAVEALVSLGYSKGEASLAIAKIEEDLPTDELIKRALKSLARGF